MPTSTLGRILFAPDADSAAGPLASSAGAAPASTSDTTGNGGDSQRAGALPGSAPTPASGETTAQGATTDAAAADENDNSDPMAAVIEKYQKGQLTPSDQVGLEKPADNAGAAFEPLSDEALAELTGTLEPKPAAASAGVLKVGALAASAKPKTDPANSTTPPAAAPNTTNTTTAAAGTNPPAGTTAEPSPLDAKIKAFEAQAETVDELKPAAELLKLLAEQNKALAERVDKLAPAAKPTAPAIDQAEQARAVEDFNQNIRPVHEAIDRIPGLDVERFGLTTAIEPDPAKLVRKWEQRVALDNTADAIIREAQLKGRTITPEQALDAAHRHLTRKPAAAASGANAPTTEAAVMNKLRTQSASRSPAALSKGAAPSKAQPLYDEDADGPTAMKQVIERFQPA